MWGSVETGPGPWPSRTTYTCSRVGKAPAGGCRVAWGRHVCLRRICSQSARESRALRGFALGHWWHPGWDFQEGQIGNPSHQTKTSLWRPQSACPRPCSVLYRQDLILLRQDLISKPRGGVLHRMEQCPSLLPSSCPDSPVSVGPKQRCRWTVSYKPSCRWLLHQHRRKH